MVLPDGVDKISIHPPPARWDTTDKLFGVIMDISIHPPPARWDIIIIVLRRPDCKVRKGISIHPPPARWDTAANAYELLVNIFQSTHLLRGGTHLPCMALFVVAFQSTHLLRGGTMPDCL